MPVYWHVTQVHRYQSARTAHWHPAARVHTYFVRCITLSGSTHSGCHAMLVGVLRRLYILYAIHTIYYTILRLSQSQINMPYILSTIHYSTSPNLLLTPDSRWLTRPDTLGPNPKEEMIIHTSEWPSRGDLPFLIQTPTPTILAFNLH
jgi:hypothetical protein